MVAPLYRCERNVELTPSPLSLCLPGVWRYVKLSCLRAVADRQPEVRNGRRSVRFHQNVSRLEIPEEEQFELEQAIEGDMERVLREKPQLLLLLRNCFPYRAGHKIIICYSLPLLLFWKVQVTINGNDG